MNDKRHPKHTNKINLSDIITSSSNQTFIFKRNNQRFLSSVSTYVLHDDGFLQGRKEVFYLMTHSTHFLWLYGIRHSER